MLPIFLDDVVHSLSQQWPCREVQVRQLANLLSPLTPSSPTLVVYGVSATCKSTIVQAVLSTLQVPHTIIQCAECVTGRHLLTRILLETLDALKIGNECEGFGKGKCEHVSTLAVFLADALAATPGAATKKFVLVLDGIDKQREAPPTLFLALARLGEVIPALSVVFILGCIPRSLFLQAAGIPYINFPMYTREEAITILTTSDSPEVNGISKESASRLYPQFISTVYDSLIGPTAGTILTFQSTCERLWPNFLAPILDGSPPGESNEWDFARLLVRNRALFRQQGEAVLVHRIVVPGEILASTAHVSNTPTAPAHLRSLPYFPTLVLTAAYLASHTSSRSDTVLFSKFASSSKSGRKKLAHHRRRLKLLSHAQPDHDPEEDTADPSTPSKRNKRLRSNRTTKSNFESSTTNTRVSFKDPSTILTARPFTLERLISIYRAIDPNPPVNPIRAPAVADSVYTELATLRRLRLIVPASGGGAAALGLSWGGGAADGEKWHINISTDWIVDKAKEIGIDVREWLGGR